MRTLSRRGLLGGVGGLTALMLQPKLGWALEKRNDVDFLRGDRPPWEWSALKYGF